MNDLLVIDLDSMLKIFREISGDHASIYAMMCNDGVTIKHLANSSKLGKKKVQNIVNELIENGYAEQINNKKYKSIA